MLTLRFRTLLSNYKQMKINIIGIGNVGTHLARALAEVGEVNLVSSRTLEGLDEGAELSIIAVPDSKIAEVAERLEKLEGIVAHTSGSTSIEILKERVKRPAVFYPLQTFSKEREMDYSELPIFLEAQYVEDLKVLEKVVLGFTSNLKVVSSEVRRKLHLAAVFANNFTNHIVALSQELLEREGIDPMVLMPLLTETFGKLREMPAADAQTGPARRGDKGTIETHLKMLKGMPRHREVYRMLSESIEDSLKADAFDPR